jgi:hypothetical protein
MSAEQICSLAWRRGGFVRAAGAGHDGRSPAFDLPVEVGSSKHVDAQASVVVVACVLPYGPGIVSLEDSAPELIGASLRDVEPESLRGGEVGALVNVDAEAQPFSPDGGDVQEPQKELDQRRIAIDEINSIIAPVRLVLTSFAPVGGGSSDEDLAVAQAADLGRRGCVDRLPLGLADGRSAAQYLRTPSADLRQHSS